MAEFTQGSRRKQQAMARVLNNDQLLTSLTEQLAITPPTSTSGAA